jgi:hypothetical protein
VKVEMKLSSNPRLTPRHETQLDEYSLARLLPRREGFELPGGGLCARHFECRDPGLKCDFESPALLGPGGESGRHPPARR